MCSDCWAVGSHAVGARKEHKFERTIEMCNSARANASHPDAQLQNRRTAIESRLSEIDAREAAVRRNIDQVAADIQERCRRALAELDSIANSKV